ncbi:serine/threonine-protein kinase [Anthocerotibacter panamensis]|uniref:serine/threonine-protein kinase n=1 Tax=Anthocerotibacter panamensis TaxID=2857077 RepID=UPI001C40228D|nr:serine/threonine-protein kinase [Anthocerotibacter panamensis]
MNPDRKNLGRVLLKALWAGGAEMLDIPTIRAGIAVVEVIRREWFVPGQQAQDNAAAIAGLTVQETRQAIEEAQQEHNRPLPPERVAELEQALLNLPRTFLAGSQKLASVADFTRMVPVRPLQYDPGQVTGDGQYQLQQFLGAGSFGEVWRARHLDKRVEHAVKFCTDPLAAQVLRRERDVLRELLSQLDTPHVVRLEQSNFAADPPYLAFAFCPGGDLVDWIHRCLQKEGRIPFPKALSLIQQMAMGLGVAHHRGIVHRDIKPGNVLLDTHGRAVITDFGLGRIGVENNLSLLAQMPPMLSSVGLGVAGTPLYMPPEIRQGRVAREDLDGLKKGDVYALGVTAFQLLIGDVEAEPTNIRRTLTRQQVPVWVIDLLEDCLSAPDERPCDAFVLCERLLQVPAPVPPTPPTSATTQIPASQTIAAKARYLKEQETPPTSEPTLLPHATPSDVVAALAAAARGRKLEPQNSALPFLSPIKIGRIASSGNIAPLLINTALVHQTWRRVSTVSRDIWKRLKDEFSS